MSGLHKNNNKQIHHLNLVKCSWEIPCQHHNFPKTQIEMKSKMNEKKIMLKRKKKWKQTDILELLSRCIARMHLHVKHICATKRTNLFNKQNT